MLIRVYTGRFGGRDVTKMRDRQLLGLARDEVALLGISARPILTRVHRWPRGMPQAVLGHPERLERIEAALEAFRPGCRGAPPIAASAFQTASTREKRPPSQWPTHTAPCLCKGEQAR